MKNQDVLLFEPILLFELVENYPVNFSIRKLTRRISPVIASQQARQSVWKEIASYLAMTAMTNNKNK